MNKYNEKDIIQNISTFGVGSLEYLVKSNIDGKYYIALRTLPYYCRKIEIEGKIQMDNRFITLKTEKDVCDELSQKTLDKIIKSAISFLTNRSNQLDIYPGDKYLNEFINRYDDCEYVKDIEAIHFNGDIDITDEVMQKLCLEKPIRKPCQELNASGITTIMSSANKYNVESKNDFVDDKKIYIGTGDNLVIGNGYAWIMLDWNKLNDINKKYLTNEVINSSDFVKLYEYIDIPKSIVSWYRYNCAKILKRLDQAYTTGEDEFDKHKIILFGHNSLSNSDYEHEISRVKTAVLRCPVDKPTKVSEVENFFASFSQILIKNNKLKDGLALKRKL